jgi:hypothetical protein
MLLRRLVPLFAVALVASTALAQTPPDQQQPPPPENPPPPPENPPPPPNNPPPNNPPPTGPVVVVTPEKPKTEPEHMFVFVKGKTEMELYGFLQLYGIYDSTQGANEQLQNSNIPRPGTYQGNHGQTMLSARHSRFGLKVAHPVTDNIKALAQLEMDFLNTVPAGFSEAQQFQNAMLRFRHAYGKVETPMVDVLAGQYWGLFAWQSSFHPASIEIQGTPAQVYTRVPQLRLSKTFKGDAVNVEVAVAAVRPPQRASATPEGQGGIKLTFNKLKGWRTKGPADSSADNAAIGVSGLVRRFAVDEFSPTPHNMIEKNGFGLSIDALLPIVGGTKEAHGNALTLTASFVTGQGIADQYNGLNFNVANPAYPNPLGLAPAPAYTPNIDNALAMYWLNPTSMQYELHTIHTTSGMVGLQYYLPPSGKVFLAANYGYLTSDNAADYGAKAWNTANYFDFNLYADPIPGWRLGAAFSVTDQTYVVPDANGVTDAKNYRVIGTMLLLF